MLHLSPEALGQIFGAAIAVVIANWHITARQTGEIMNRLNAFAAHVETQKGVNTVTEKTLATLSDRILANEQRIDFLFVTRAGGAPAPTEVHG